MAEIRHRIGIENTTPEQVYEKLTTLDGLSGWWTEKTSGSTERNGVIEFRFGPGGIDMRVAELAPPNRVVWEVAGGPDEWIRTHVRWEIARDGDWTIVLFTHEGWQDTGAFMAHCSTKWATFLLSLKELVETGTGSPDPRDRRISDWH